MSKIIISITDNKLNFAKRSRLNVSQKNLMNTNIIDKNELIFSYEYIKNNNKIVMSFLKELIENNNITTITIKEYEISDIILDLIKNINSIKSIYFLEQTPIKYKTVEKIINLNNINFISVYSLQNFMLEIFDKNNIIVDSRSEILFFSNFMIYNKLDKLSNLYYKTNINLSFPISDNDIEDLSTFLNINKYLKSISINTSKISDIEELLYILNKLNVKNIKIIINDNINDPVVIDYLKKINKLNKKINNIHFKIEYSKDYLENNMMKEINLSTFKLIILIIIFILLTVLMYNFIINYNSLKKVDTIKNDINNIIKNYTNNSDIDNNIINNNTQYKIPEEEIELTEYVKALKEVNEDTVGYLKVNNTNVDYPVLKYSDNDYYLNHNFNKEKDVSGWIYMDYRNNDNILDKNTIIYGHNMYYTGVMFGTLYKTKQSSWYTNIDNQIISFDTLYGEYKWKIFSIYVTPVTSDYLKINFDDNNEFLKFTDMLTKRSIYDFGIPILENDKILTLTTCSNKGTKRLVIHAVLMN